MRINISWTVHCQQNKVAPSQTQFLANFTPLNFSIKGNEGVNHGVANKVNPLAI